MEAKMPDQPQKPPHWTEQEWKDHLDDVKAFERRNYRQSAGQRAAQSSQHSPPKSKT
jgi:hypothetical protein